MEKQKSFGSTKKALEMNWRDRLKRIANSGNGPVVVPRGDLQRALGFMEQMERVTRLSVDDAPNFPKPKRVKNRISQPG